MGGEVVMDSDRFLGRLADELEAFARCLDGDLSQPVTTSDDWTLRKLANHLGQGNQWVVAAVVEKRYDYFGHPAPEDDSQVAGWFRAAAHTLVETLGVDPSTPAWTYSPLKTVGFWRRRCCHEAMIYRWDVENALGKSPAFEPEWAADGITESLDTLVPPLVSVGRLDEPEKAVRFVATDSGDTWTHGPGEPIAEVRATASDLLLGLWRRKSFTDPGFSWTGDEGTALEVLSPTLVSLGLSTKQCPEHEQEDRAKAKARPHGQTAKYH